MKHRLQHKEASATAVLSPAPWHGPGTLKVYASRQHNAALDTGTQALWGGQHRYAQYSGHCDALRQCPRPFQRSYQQPGPKMQHCAKTSKGSLRREREFDPPIRSAKDPSTGPLTGVCGPTLSALEPSIGLVHRVLRHRAMETVRHSFRLSPPC